MRDPFDQKIIDWSVVEELEKADTLHSKALALAECDKILRYLLREKGVRGKNLAEKIEKVKTKISNLADFLTAVETKEKIFDKFGQEVKLPEIEKAITAYKTAITDLAVEELGEPVSKKTKADIILFWHKNKTKIGKVILKTIIFIAVILLLDSTHFGQKIVKFLATTILSLATSFWFWCGLFILVLVLFLCQNRIMSALVFLLTGSPNSSTAKSVIAVL